MQKSGCSLCKSEHPLYKEIPSEKSLLLLKNKVFFLNHQMLNTFGYFNKHEN